jgi:hypothetical protein
MEVEEQELVRLDGGMNDREERKQVRKATYISKLLISGMFVIAIFSKSKGNIGIQEYFGPS